MGILCVENPIDELIDESAKFEEMGYQDGLCLNVDGVDDFLNILLKGEVRTISDVIENLFIYLCGYQIGEYISKLEIKPGEDIESLITENIFKVKTAQRYNAGILASKLSKNFESPKRLYNIARRDIVVLKKNNAELIAKILIKSHYDEKTICLMINKYLEGIDFETNKKTIEDEELEFLEPMHPLCFLGEAHHILERVCE